MKKIIGIYYNAEFTEKSFETGCGGSDTWVIQISKEFVKHGYHVIVFCDCKDWVITENGVEYVPTNYFQMRCEYQKFDYFILTRLINEELYNTVVNTGCKNIFIQSHDMFIWHNELYDEKYVYNPEKYPYLKYVALTDYHKWELNTYNNIPNEMIEVIGNGVDSDIFDSVDNEDVYIKDNNILFPSVFSRGGDILVNNILPLVRELLPEFKVHLCGYSQKFPDNVRNNPNVKILGMLSKEDYYREFKKHKVWFLPCVVPEDFGLCACEAAMCGCEIVSTYKHGMKDVFFPFVNHAMKNSFFTQETNEYHYSHYKLRMTGNDFHNTCVEAANMIVDSIKHYYDKDRIFIRESYKNFILGTHTWNNVVNKWKNLFLKSEKK